MSAIELDLAKNHLRVLHDADDALIQAYIDGAEDECLQFMDRSALPFQGSHCPDDCSDSDVSEVSDVSSDGVIAKSVVIAVLLLTEAAYYSKTLSPYEVQMRRDRAETLCMPYRCRLGV